MKMRGGSKVWYVADGWMPLESRTRDPGYAGHEAIMVLNSSDRDAVLLMDVYFEEKDPIEGIRLLVPAKRIRCFRMDHPDEIVGLKLERLSQYALRFRSNVPVVVQYGRMDVTQPNLAYIGTMGHAES
jgi:hypothetical protein